MRSIINNAKERIGVFLVNTKNFILKTINFKIGKAYLIFLTIYILILTLSILISGINGLNDEIRYIAFIIACWSLTAVVFMLAWKIYYIFVANKHSIRKKKSLIFIISVLVAIILSLILFILYLGYETIRKDISIDSAKVIITNLISILINLFSAYNLLEYRKNMKSEEARMRKIMAQVTDLPNAKKIALKNFNSESTCGLYVYKVIDEKNIWVGRISLIPNEVYEFECEPQADRIRILSINDEGLFRIGLKSEIQALYKKDFQFNDGKVSEIEYEDLPLYPNIKSKISVRAIVFDIETLINKESAYKSLWKSTVVELRKNEPDRSISIEMINGKLNYYKHLEGNESIKSMTDALGIEKLGGYNYRKEKAYRGAASFIHELSKNKSVLICAVGRKNSESVERFIKSYLGSLFNGRIYTAESPLRAIQNAIEDNGLSTEECLMIGGSVENGIAPAKKLGMKTMRIKQGFNADADNNGIAADIEIHDIKNARYEINF